MHIEMSHTSGVKKLKAIATITATAAVVDNQHWHSLSFWIWSYFQLQACTYTWHTSKIDVLCSRLNSKETLRNFLYLYKEKTHVVFSWFEFGKLVDHFFSLSSLSSNEWTKHYIKMKRVDIRFHFYLFIIFYISRCNYF